VATDMAEHLLCQTNHQISYSNTIANDLAMTEWTRWIRKSRVAERLAVNHS
jgi:hypothetical protein